MIEAQKVSFRYPHTRTPVLDEVSFRVADGEIVAVVGGNGCGKSTLGRIVAGITTAKSGSIECDAEGVGVVFQNPENQIIFSRIEDELAFALGELPEEERKARIEKALKEVELPGFENRNLYELSLGQRQRVVFAEMLAQNLRNLVLDEPTTMIDTLGKTKIHRLIRRLRAQGHAILLLTNLAEEIILADRILLLENGKIAREIKREELLGSAEFLRKHGILLPAIPQVALELEARGIKLDLTEFSAEELAERVAERVAAVFCLPNSPLILGCFLFHTVIIAVARLRAGEILRKTLGFWPFIIFTFVFNVWLDAFPGAVWTMVKLLIVCNFTMIYAATTSVLGFAKAMEKICAPLSIFGLRAEDVKILICVALSMIPFLKQDFLTLRNAARAKGMKYNLKNAGRLMAKFFLGIFARAEQLEAALIAKGYRE